MREDKIKTTVCKILAIIIEATNKILTKKWIKQFKFKVKVENQDLLQSKIKWIDWKLRLCKCNNKKLSFQSTIEILDLFQ